MSSSAYRAACLLAALAAATGLAAEQAEQAGPAGAAPRRQRVNASEASGLELCLEAGTTLRPGTGHLDLDPNLSLSLSSGAARIDTNLPLAVRVVEGGTMGALRDLEVGATAFLPRGGTLWSIGLAATAPTGRAPPWEGRAGAGSSYWRADASFEAARILDPVAAAARAHCGALLPRQGTRRGAAALAGFGLSLAEALNDRVSLGASVGIEATVSGAGPSFAGGAALAIALKARALSFRAALSWSLGDEGSGGPGASVALSRSFAIPRAARKGEQ